MDMNEIANPQGPVAGSVVRTRINRILKQRYGKLTTKAASELSESEERIQKIAEALEEVSFGFSKNASLVRR
jgi:hypothetical protein